MVVDSLISLEVKSGLQKAINGPPEMEMSRTINSIVSPQFRSLDISNTSFGLKNHVSGFSFIFLLTLSLNISILIFGDFIESYKNGSTLRGEDPILDSVLNIYVVRA